ncbi:MAG: hypothetical protein EOO71_07250 [Myxococcaceae bacterium]|nr:MAG: hypothetical protein EOO71_07250 [Myxococcaceae bacterium]
MGWTSHATAGTPAPRHAERSPEMTAHVAEDRHGVSTRKGPYLTASCAHTPRPPANTPMGLAGDRGSAHAYPSTPGGSGHRRGQALAMGGGVGGVGARGMSVRLHHGGIVTSIPPHGTGGFSRCGLRGGAVPDDGRADGTAQPHPVGEQRRRVRRDGGRNRSGPRLHQHRDVHLGRASDRMLEALSQRAAKGVTCRVLVDPMGSGPFEKEVKPKLEAAGCEAHMFRPLPADENLARNHRKIVVVDGKVAITGGLAIQDEWLGEARNEQEWRDTNVRVQGPVVAQLQQAFAENWQESTGELLPLTDFPTLSQGQPGLDDAGEGWAGFVSSTANPEVTRAERLTQLMVKAAKHRLWISQAYFTPNDALMQLLMERAKAGVDVRVLAPGDKNDQRAITVLQRQTYDALLAAGVRLWEFQPSMMHAKTMLVDDRLVLVGSINYDALSFNLLEEGSLVLEDVDAARQLEAIFLEDLTKAREVQAERAAR